MCERLVPPLGRETEHGASASVGHVRSSFMEHSLRAASLRFCHRRPVRLDGLRGRPSALSVHEQVINFYLELLKRDLQNSPDLPRCANHTAAAGPATRIMQHATCNIYHATPYVQRSTRNCLEQYPTAACTQTCVCVCAPHHCVRHFASKRYSRRGRFVSRSFHEHAVLHEADRERIQLCGCA